VYEEANDVEASFTKLSKTDVKKKWDEAMATILEESGSRVFDEVFHLEGQVVPTDHDS
jgi:L-rhamnose mutarotase